LVQPRVRDEKTVHAIAFFASRGVRDLTRMKVAKLLYFADKAHLRRHGRLITGDTYFFMNHGPVPSVALALMDGALGKTSTDWTRTEPLFHRVLAAEHDSQACGQAVFCARVEPDPDVFSESDLEVLEEVCTRYGSMTASDLRKASHLEPDHLAAEAQRGGAKRQPIPVEGFLMGLPEDEKQEILGILEIEDEDRRFVASL
jgi:uncharacterized phage-associated protein